MVTSLQLSELAGSIRQDKINQLSQLATDLQLSYTIDEDSMTITLPSYDEVELPVVAKIEVPLDETETK
jgi:hypothetical protein